MSCFHISISWLTFFASAGAETLDCAMLETKEYKWRSPFGTARLCFCHAYGIERSWLNQTADGNMKHGACQNPGNDPDHRYFLPRSPHRAVLYTSFERIHAWKLQPKQRYANGKRNCKTTRRYGPKGGRREEMRR